jgi:hypothetical protein
MFRGTQQGTRNLRIRTEIWTKGRGKKTSQVKDSFLVFESPPKNAAFQRQIFNLVFEIKAVSKDIFPLTPHLPKSIFSMISWPSKSNSLTSRVKYERVLIEFKTFDKITGKDGKREIVKSLNRWSRGGAVLS